MLIRNLKLSGFKGIDQEVSIPLAPISLLFGGNSSGKSTILQAFLYLYELLVNNNPDPQEASFRGGAYLPRGFESIVNQKKLDKKISIEVEMDTSNVILKPHLSETEMNFIQESSTVAETGKTFEINEPAVGSVAVRVEVAFKNGAYINQIAVSLDGEEFSRITQEANSKQVLMTLNREFLVGLDEIYGDESIRNFIDTGMSDFDFITLDKLKTVIPTGDRLQIAEGGWHGDGSISESPFVEKMFAEAVLSQLIVSPVNLLVSELKKLVQIGPVREVPARGYCPNKSPNDWYKGLGAWDKFAYASNLLQTKVNAAFAESGFNSKYEFVVDGKYKNVLVRDVKFDIHHEPSELGIGISQVFPFVVAVTDKSLSFVSVEQPELHIHPAWQLYLGDLLIQCIKEDPSRLFLIETHSEHLMLRLLSRVRLQEGDDGFDEALKVDPELVSVICVYSDENGVPTYERQTITSDGDFEHDWPEGFFEEREEELF